ncbi:MAG: hypothetical protein ACE5NP_08590 [Anaerolineae bacterium]
MHRLVSLAAVASVALVLLGCVRAPLLSGVEVRPSTISPNADGHDDVARITYRLSQRSTLSIYFTGEDGQRHYFRKDKRRSPGQYEALFGGVVGGSVLPDGTYTYTVEAVDLQGNVERIEGQIKVANSDTALPELRNFTVFPTTFTPNQDGINDRVSISYYLAKRADVKVYLLDEKGKKYFIAEKEGSAEPGEPGLHQYDYDGGVDAGATPPPDGTYTVVAEAVDEIGSRVSAQASLTIVDGGVPRAEIVGATAEFSPIVVPLGQTLTFTATVANVGTVPIRTKGPPPGTTYTTRENFNVIGYYEEPGIFRIGVDFEGNSQGRKYPYRWSLGSEEDLATLNGYKYLMPGQRVTVVGHIQIIDAPPKVNPYYWVGLIHEQVRIVNDFVEPTQISIGF